MRWRYRRCTGSAESPRRDGFPDSLSQIFAGAKISNGTRCQTAYSVELNTQPETGPDDALFVSTNCRLPETIKPTTQMKIRSSIAVRFLLNPSRACRSRRTGNAARCLALAGLALTAAPLFAADFTSTWTGGNSTWGVGANWSTPLAPGTFPNNGFPTPTYDAILGVTSIVTLDQNITIQKFTMSTGTVTGTFGLTTKELFAWTGGTMSGVGVLNANGGLSLAGGTKTLNGRTINNTGAATWTAGQLSTGNGAIFNNQLGATFDTNFDGTLANNQGGAALIFNNAGTFTKSAGALTTTFGAIFANTGTVNADSGTLSLSGSVTQHSGTTLLGGTWNVSNGASLNITTGSNITTNQGSVTLDGVGSSFAKFTTALTSNQGSFTLKNDRDLTTAGALANSGNVTVDGAGTTLTIQGANAFSQTAGATLLSNGGQITAAAVTLTGGTFTVNGGATGAVLAVTNAGAGLTFGGTSSPTITLNSSNSVAGKILLTNDVTVNNTLTSGTAQILSGGSAANPGAIDLDGGTRTFSVNNGSAAVDLLVSASLQNGALTKTGAGTQTLSGANTYTGGTTLTAGILNLGVAQGGGGGPLGGSGMVATVGTIVFNGGTLQFSAANTTDYSSRFSESSGMAYRLSIPTVRPSTGALVAPRPGREA